MSQVASASMSTQPPPIKAVCFDFDGVMFSPWGHPPQPFPHTRAVLHYLHRHGILLAGASFNPHAWTALEEHGLASYFSAFRIGCNKIWDHRDYSKYNDAEHRVGLCKGKQMADILANEWNDRCLDPKSIILVDDDLKNTQNAEAVGFRAFFVPDSYIGPVWRNLAVHFSHIPPPSSAEMRTFTINERDMALQKAAVAMGFLGKMEKYAPEKVNIALSQLGALSKSLGPAAPPAELNATVPGSAELETAESDMDALTLIVRAAQCSMNQLCNKVISLQRKFSDNGFEVALQQLSPEERVRCAQIVGTYPTLSDGGERIAGKLRVLHERLLA